jgi:hypothetical protein
MDKKGPYDVHNGPNVNKYGYNPGSTGLPRRP